MIKKLINKFNGLKGWQKAIIVTTAVVLLPLAIVGVFALLAQGRGADDITEELVDQKKDQVKETVENAKKKDAILSAKQTVLEIERNRLRNEAKNNEAVHAEISNRIDDASTVDELRAIARKIRGDRP